jgi:hypothetical protein
MTRQLGAGGRASRPRLVSLELAVLAPALLLVISFIISVGRVTDGRALGRGRRPGCGQGCDDQPQR